MMRSLLLLATTILSFCSRSLCFSPVLLSRRSVTARHAVSVVDEFDEQGFRYLLDKAKECAFADAALYSNSSCMTINDLLAGRKPHTGPSTSRPPIHCMSRSDQ